MLMIELLELIRKGEGPKLEFKRDDIRPEALAKEIVAFANTNGGIILIGVEDDGDISGVQRDDLQTWVMDTVISRYMSPHTPADYDEMTIEGKKIAIITVPFGVAKPYVLRHNDRDDVYVRRGNTCQLAQREEMMRLFDVGGHISTEKMAIPECRVDELDENRVKPYFAKILRHGSEKWEREKETLLRDHDFSRVDENSNNVYVTLLGCVLFAKNPWRYLPQAGIRLLVFSNKRDDEGRDFVMDEVLKIPFIGLDINESEETHLTNWVMKYLKPHISCEQLDAEVSYRRQTSWDYPQLALRELIVNAFAHRDWTKQKQIEVAVFADCMEITSPGALPNGMTLEKMKGGGRATRNSRMLDVLRIFKFAEDYGLGISQRVIPEMLEKNGCEPIFEATEDYFRVILPKKPA